MNLVAQVLPSEGFDMILILGFIGFPQQSW